ncbi:Urease accessory protein UreE [Paramagnetospirillum kuznetsovii]|uniref:Urease accessory protein UreE n=1 Tax=Paramagnetospirillum kuznetsovii TaxID=2053833 RepID=A0A364NUA9_9PROT|nr:urease accessory protein UreE [Paramagnetospirillum kuznetsovii]RAU20467.1 Urease accessory protein UreE [Paramagnetospirillum kuznetsovii]
MRRATAILAAGTFAETTASVTLAAHDRHRRRFRMCDDSGAEFLLDLPNAVHLKDGDGLALDGGGVIVVRAAREEVADIHCNSPDLAARVAWHVGNRHVPVQVLAGGGLRVTADPVLMDMVEGLGASVTRHTAPFQPEPGAYDPHGLLAAPEPLVRWG